MVRLLFRKLRRDVRAQRAQFVAVMVTLGIGIVLFGASYDAFQNLQASYDRLFVDLRFASLWVTGGDAPQITQAAQGDPDVSAVATRSVADVSFRIAAAGGGEHKLFGSVVGMPAAGQPAVNRVLVQDGGYLDPAKPDGVLVEQHLAAHFHLAPGSHIDVYEADGWHTLDVLGVAASAEYLWPARSRQDILTSPDDFGVIFAPEPLVAALPAARVQTMIRLRDGADAAAADARLAAQARGLGGLDAYTRAEQPSNAALQEDIQGFGEMSVMFPLLFLSAAMMGTYILLSRLVHSQREVIGTLRASGLGARTILLHYLEYGLAAGLVASIPAAVIGVLLGRAITGAYTAEISLPITVHGLHAGTAAVGVIAGTVAGLIAAAAPAFAALRVEAAEAMRGMAPTGGGGLSLWERLLPPLRGLPARWRMTLRNVGRNKRRSVYTASGVVLALTLVIVAWGMLDTIDILLNRQFNQVQQWNASLHLSEPADAAAVQTVANVDGVARAEGVLDAVVVVSHGDRAYGTELLAYPAGTQMHRFLRVGGGEATLPPDGGVLLGVAMRDLLGIRVGDTVTLSLPNSSLGVERPVAGFVSEPLGTFAYVSLGALQQAVAARGGAAAAALVQPNEVQLRYAAGVGGATMRDRLTALPGVTSFTDARALLDSVQSLLGLFYVIIGAMLVFGGLMASALIFNTMSANVAERSAEMAGLRAAGLARSTLSRLIAAENLLLVVLGIPFGLVIGYLVAGQFMASFSSDLFQFGLQMRARTFVLAALGMLVVAGIAQIPALRSAGRIDLARVVRQRSA